MLKIFTHTRQWRFELTLYISSIMGLILKYVTFATMKFLPCVCGFLHKYWTSGICSMKGVCLSELGYKPCEIAKVHHLNVTFPSEKGMAIPAKLKVTSF